MKLDKQHVLEIFHRSLVPFLIAFRRFRTFVLIGFENFEEKLEHAAMPKALHLTGKTVMITGAGGGIGSEISRQLIQYQPARILLLGDGPKSIYTVESQLQKRVGSHAEIIPIVVDIQDKKRIFEIVGRYKPDIVYHTDGHQQLDVAEEKTTEALCVHVFGTYNIAEAANGYRVNTFVMVSSEQAAKPRNFKEAVKRLAEMTVESVSTTSSTQYTIFRSPETLLHDKQLSKRSGHLFEQKAPVVYTAQQILQAGETNIRLGKESSFHQKDAVVRIRPKKQTGISQIELARLLKQLKKNPKKEARELVISIIKKERTKG
ncbi:Capsular polysaccharide biosynthesis protein capD [Planococcus antarcticus DSM 14505]|uniref:Capsular polysaccharide biosynthesis protein capD n=1 Tax=Planococcus antarcticus DSM 14505 TaxID=1185653 RepID=A0A1C7DFP5_9BACL|nr:SDR family NAD(P)-dependent oxidoreductase [Planococcus antarcticus]ANU10248.1 capsule biosynthesis protein CapD [Planococcus antarcticus DSM 14505]EIM07155.1 Capsular polysaccharide biosynthesis protein capD [Planococcus antarcticus DSM 14505]